MSARTTAIAVFAVTALLLAHCDDKREAAAAGAPKIEIRATVAGGRTGTAVAAVDGRIATLTVKEGSPVNAGDVVATIVNPSIDRDLAYARAQVSIAEQRLRAAQRPPARTSVVAGAAARERATAEILANRTAKRDRYRALYKTRDVSKQELEDAENEYSAAMRDWLAERERATENVARTDTNLLQLELERARAEEAYVTDRKSLLHVTAPITGIVTSVRVRQGETIFTRDPIIEVANNSTVEVRGPIAPELLRYVQTGMPVEVKVFTVPPRRFTVPARTVAGGGSAMLVADLPNPDAVLQAGQQAVITVR